MPGLFDVIQDVFPDYGNYGADHTPGFDTGAMVPDPDQLALYNAGQWQGPIDQRFAPVNQLDQVYWQHDYDRTLANAQGNTLGVIAADLRLFGDAIAAIFAGPEAVTNTDSPFPAPFDTIYGYGYAIGSAVLVGLGGAAVAAVSGVVETAIDIGGAVFDGIGSVADGLYGFAGDVFGGIGDAFGGLWGGISDFGGSVFGGIGDAFGGFFGGVGDAVGGFFSDVGEFFSRLF